MAAYTPSSASSADGEARKLTIVYFHNEFPRGDLLELSRHIRQQSQSVQHATLAAFLRQATLAVREETQTLSTQLQALLPSFDTVLDLVNQPQLRKGPLCGAIEGVLLCLVEFATLIGHYESSNEGFDFNPVHTCFAGLGVGLLVSAAVSLAPTLADLPQTATEALRVAFRVGILVNEASQHLETPEEVASPDSWAYVVSDVSPTEIQRELDALQTPENTPNTSKIFISAVSRSSATLSGPPSRLKHLFCTSPFFRSRRFITLPVYAGLCHAGHIYRDEDIRSVVDVESIRALDSKRTHMVPVYSTSQGKPYSARSASHLFEHIVREILTQQIHWEKVVHGIQEQASNSGAVQCQISGFGISMPINDLVGALKSALPDCKTNVEDFLSWMTRNPGMPSSTKQSKLAIIGMACRLPDEAVDTEKFWSILENGLDVHKKIPADRFDVEAHYDPTGKRMNTTQTPYGCFINQPGLFDAPFFNMSPLEAKVTDPMQRLALVTAYEALERAGYVANRTKSTNAHRIGTWYGQSSDDYREANSAQEVGTYYIPGGCRAFGPGRINYFFKFSGPSFSCDTACSSSLAAIQAACTSLWNGDTDMVVTGGMNVLTHPDGFSGLSHGHFLSKTGNACKTWDVDANGYCRADGVGTVVIKRLEDAEADNDNILGVILGAATNHSAEAISITHPHAKSQAYLFNEILNQAAVDPLDVSYVEMHGTGTQAGDMVEIASVTDVFAPSSRRRRADQPLHIGAVKSNVGHSEAAAGITALLKVLMMFEKNAIPQHVGIKTALNPGFPKDLDQRNVRIPYERQEWPRVPGKRRIAAVNNFSAAGGNTMMLLEEPPVRSSANHDPRSTHAITVSAKSKSSMRGNLEKMIAYVDKHPEVSMSNLSYTTTARRHHHNYRMTFSASDAIGLRRQLQAGLSKVETQKAVPAEQSDVAFLFTGQGASHKTMDLELFQTSPVFRSHLLLLDSLARAQGFPSFIPAIDGRHPKDYAHSPTITQLALVCTEIALAKYWASLGVEPNLVVGHSLGEYAALHIAGVLSANDAIFLVGRRAQLLEQKCRSGSHKMLAVRASLPAIQATVGNLPYEISCTNGPRETVLSGSAEQVAAITGPLEANGYRCIALDVAFAFHSSQTDPILEEFEKIATSGAIFHEPRLPIVSPLLGKVIFDDKTINATYLRRATRETVDFESALRSASQMEMVDDTTIWVEIGPHPVCVSFVKSVLPHCNLTVPSVRRGEDDWSVLTQSLGMLHDAGITVDWQELHRPFEKQLQLLDLPTYAWNDKTHWIMYNGDWTLRKGNTFYDEPKTVPAVVKPLTSTVHQILLEDIKESSARVVIQSDLMQEDFREAAYGHNMNGCGVVTSSIHADIAYTLGDHIYKKFFPKAKDVTMEIANLEVLKGLVANKDPNTPQLIQVSAETANIHNSVMELKWYFAQPQGTQGELFASATLSYGKADDWISSWAPLKHLVQSRIDDLERMAREGSANRFSHKMAYQLFAHNLVDYAEKYRGMKSVVLHEFEGFADIELSTKKGGTWNVPPFFIDSVAHLAGFIMNVTDSIDQKANFCVTPGVKSMRLARPLVAGGKYRSYVKMIPTPEDPAIFLGDVYVFQDDTIIGVFHGIKFRRYPRLLLDRFFSAPDAHHSGPKAVPIVPKIQTEISVIAPVKEIAKPTTPMSRGSTVVDEPISKTNESTKTLVAAAAAAAAVVVEQQSKAAEADSVSMKAIALIARESSLEIEDLADEAPFLSLGIDSLMSLVIVEKFREQLGVTVGGSLFLEYPTVGDLRSWLKAYYG